MQLMMNIAPWTIYYGMFPFKNAVLAAEDFHGQPIYQLQNCCTITGGQVTAINVGFDQYGWPTSLSGPHGVYGSQQATLYLGASDVYNFMPAGAYLLSAVGTGWISVEVGNGTGGFSTPQFFQFTGTNGTPQSFEVTIGATGQMTVANINISLWESGGANYLRNVQFMMPDPAYATATSPSTTPYATAQPSIWHDTYIAELRGAGPGYSAYRMMDLLGTNGSSITGWGQLAQCDGNLMPLGTTSFGNQVQIPYQVLLNLLATLNPAADVYWNIPFHATDAFVTSCAGFLQANFPNKVYLEYSNEVWNAGFQQFTDAANAGATQFGGGTYSGSSQEYNYNRQWYGYRSKLVHDLARAAFASDPRPSRLVPVFSSVVIGDADTPGSAWYEYVNTGAAYGPAIAPTLIINGYYGAAYTGNQTDAAGRSLTDATLATGPSAVLAAWGTAGGVERRRVVGLHGAVRRLDLVELDDLRGAIHPGPGHPAPRLERRRGGPGPHDRLGDGRDVRADDAVQPGPRPGARVAVPAAAGRPHRLDDRGDRPQRHAESGPPGDGLADGDGRQ